MNFRLGLIGYPVKHSLSPWIHSQLLNIAELEGEYNVIEIKPDHLSRQLLDLKNKKINGFNVTVPYKEKIIPYLDEIDDEARAMGAVNTVLQKNNKWIGFNTDGKGYLRALENKFPGIMRDKMKSILIIGAGGASRGIYYALNSAGFKRVDIANRTLEKAESVLKLKNYQMKSSCLSIKGAEATLDKYEIIIQTTSVGMKPREHEKIMKLDQLKPGTIVSDIVYQPIMTSFLQDAKERKASIHMGHTMLIYQAQYAFEIWTKNLVPVDTLNKKLQAILEAE